MTGLPVKFEVVHGADARKDPLMPKADLDTDYIKVTLARPVPEHGQGRVIIIKTYKDAKSYYTDGAAIVFNRPLGIKRTRSCCQRGMRLPGCTVPSQILTEPTGGSRSALCMRVQVEAPLVLRAVKDAQVGSYTFEGEFGQKLGVALPGWSGPYGWRNGRTRTGILFTSCSSRRLHSFSLYHDHTESRTGISAYANVVREGSKASNPDAYIVDTGEHLPTKVMTGAAMAAKYNAGEEVDAKADVVVIPFPRCEGG